MKIEGGSLRPKRLVQFSFRISKTRIDAEEMNKLMCLTDLLNIKNNIITYANYNL